MYGSSRMKREKVELGGKTIMIKQGALHKALKTKGDYKFTKMDLQRVNKNEIGSMFKFKGNDFKMTPLMKKRVTLAINLMKRKK
jgi:hypothetical protein